MKHLTHEVDLCVVGGGLAGMCAAIAARDGLSPRGVYQRRIVELKQTLMEDDCYLPWNVRDVPALARTAQLTASEGDPEPLRNGLDRPIDGQDNGWIGGVGAWVQYGFAEPRAVHQVRLVFDSNLNRPGRNMLSNYPLHFEPARVPAVMTRAFRVEALDAGGGWQVVAREENNYQRLVRLPLNVTARAVRVVLEATWGAERAHLFAFDVR